MLPEFIIRAKKIIEPALAPSPHKNKIKHNRISLHGGFLERPTNDEYFMQMAHLVSRRTTCLRRGVGAVLVKDKRVLATGYNGAPKGLEHCEKTGCLREEMNVPSGERHELCRGVHAEQNAIIQAAVFGVSVRGASIYITNHPCSVCTKMIINAGIDEIVYEGDYHDELAKKLISEANIEMRRV